MNKNFSFLKILLATVLFFCFCLIPLTSCGGDEEPNTEETEDGGNEEFHKKSDEELIEARIKEFLTAYNSGDMNATMNCLDAKTKNAMNALLNLFGGVFGGATGYNIDLRDLFSLGVAVEEGDFMNLQVSETKISGKSAVVTTTMSLPDVSGQKMYFIMLYENNGWFISDISDKNPNFSSSNPSENPLESIDEAFLTESGYSEGLEYILSKDQTYYICVGLGDCKDTHIRFPEYPVDYNPLPLKKISVDYWSSSSLSSVEYITVPKTVDSINWYSENLLAVNYLGTLSGWCNVEPVGYRNSGSSYEGTNPLSNGTAVLYINNTTVIGELVIDDSCEKISDKAFQGYSKISKLVIGKNVKSIGDFAFYNTPLTEIVFENEQDATIENYAFSQTKIKYLFLGDKITDIGEHAFYNCESLEGASLGNGVLNVGKLAFGYCKNLRAVTKGSSATEIAPDAFDKTAFISAGSAWDKGMLYVGNCLYKVKSDVINAEIKEGTLTINSGTFRWHENVTNLVLPDSVTYLGESSFEACSNLKSIRLSSSLKSIENYTFYACNSLEEIIIPDSVEIIKEGAFNGCSSLKKVTLGKGLKTIEECFYRCDALEAFLYAGNREDWNSIENYYEYWMNEDGMTLSAETGMPINALQFGDSFYMAYYCGENDWNVLKENAESRGGHLATITSEEEMEAITAYLREIFHETIFDYNSSANVYIGLSDSEEEGILKWVTGEPVEYKNFKENYEESFNSDDKDHIYIDLTQYENSWYIRNLADYTYGCHYLVEWEK